LTERASVWVEPRNVTHEACGGYEFRPVSYMSFACRTPYRLDIGPEWDAIRRAVAHRMAYEVEGDCEPQEHEDRANREDCWRDWWKTGRDWIQPEADCDEES
jgi:hypothetical protein